MRTLVLREIEDGFGLFVNASSPKWRGLARDDRCQVTTWYPSLQRQWRLSARARPLARDLLEQHWRRRPRSSQVMDHVYEQGLVQSGVVDDPEAIRRAHAELDARLGTRPPVPAGALALELVIASAECLQIHPADRLHDRWRYMAEGDHWQRVALVP